VTIEIVILAMIAAFLALRLYSVLGRRAEHGEEPMQPHFEAPQGGIGAPPLVRVPGRPAQPDTASSTVALPSVERALREISQADRKFDITSFLDGARTAYGLVLEAFWRGDEAELARLTDATVAAHFAEAIAARKAAGEVLDHRLVRINDAIITGARLESPVAHVTVRFIADIAAVTRDGEGKVIAGSLDDAVEVRDVWTFARNLSGANPDWVLEETDEG